MANKYKGKVNYKRGIVLDPRTGASVESQAEAWQKEAECGCGINCCTGELVLSDQVTGVSHSLFFNNGSLFSRNNSTGVVVEVQTEAVLED